MKKLLILMLTFLAPACGLSDNNLQNEIENEQPLVFKTGNVLTQIIDRNIEVDEKCPSIVLLRSDNHEIVSSADLCQINIPGYRQFHALKDFAYIEYDNYRLQKPSTILYDVDLALLKGSAFVITCQVRIINQSILPDGCQKNE